MVDREEVCLCVVNIQQDGCIFGLIVFTASPPPHTASLLPVSCPLFICVLINLSIWTVQLNVCLVIHTLTQDVRNHSGKQSV